MAITPKWPLEPDSATLREWTIRTLDRLLPFLDGLPQQPTHNLEGSHRLARELREGLPERGQSYRSLLGQLFERILPVSLNTASPGYLAYIPGGGLPQAGLADFIADLCNRYTGLWMPAPGLVQLEINVLRWFCTMVGYGPESGGILTTGGSLANLGAVVAARKALLPENFLNGILYTSSQAHHSLKKAAMVAGFPAQNFRELPVDASFRLDPEALRRQIAADRGAGKHPFFLAAHAGSTATGAVDDFPTLAEIAAEEKLWLHIDAAYGGFFLLTERGQKAMPAIARADSVTLDPHKGLFLPYGTGCLLVKDLHTLRAANAVTAAYLPPPQADADCWDFADLGPELSRDTRGLRVWLPLKLHGAGAFRDALNEKLDLARTAAEQFRVIPQLRIVSEPILSLFSFRLEPSHLPAEEWDGYNRRLLSRINKFQRVILTGVTLPDPRDQREIFVIRVCVLSFRTHQDRMEMLLEDLQAALADPRG